MKTTAPEKIWLKIPGEIAQVQYIRADIASERGEKLGNEMKTSLYNWDSLPTIYECPNGIKEVKYAFRTRYAPGMVCYRSRLQDIPNDAYNIEERPK